MKREKEDLFPALLVGLMANVFLRGQTSYWVRPGILLAPISMAVLAATAFLFAKCWRDDICGILRWAFASLLAFGSALELLRLWQLFDSIYANSVTLLGVCFTVLVPVIYLRRVSSIAQTSNVVFWMLVLAAILLVISVIDRLRVVNLQTVIVDEAVFGETITGQLTLYPELLLPALWASSRSKKIRNPARLSIAVVGLDVAIHLLLELFFGAAMPGRSNPVHTAAQTGALSVFNRLEWLQLVLWSAAISVKLALYLYAAVRLVGGNTGKTENNAVGLDRFPLYFVVMLLLCAWLGKVDLGDALVWHNVACWIFAGAVVMGGMLRCLFPKPNSV